MSKTIILVGERRNFLTLSTPREIPCQDRIYNEVLEAELAREKLSPGEQRILAKSPGGMLEHRWKEKGMPVARALMMQMLEAKAFAQGLARVQLLRMPHYDGSAWGESGEWWDDALNLVPARRDGEVWALQDQRVARAVAREVRIYAAETGALAIFLGNRAQKSAGIGPLAPDHFMEPLILGANMLVGAMPHPSGQCRSWNVPENCRRAAKLIRWCVAWRAGTCQNIDKRQP